jgi:3D (Asp-Asp-Asp) domain-containing protein
VRRSVVIVLALLACGALAAPAGAGVIRKPRWLGRVAVTEYYPVPEDWFVGQKVVAPGLPGQHRIDWLYSARGVSMEGDGIDLDGIKVHIDNLGSGGWVDEHGRSTSVGGHGSRGAPFWRAGAYWKSADGWLTFPLDIGGWFRGDGRRYVNPPGSTFAIGPSRDLTPYKSVAVDPRLIAFGSKVYIPQYSNQGGWFVAEDTGGAIQGRHVDVYRTPPQSIDDRGQSFDNARIYVLPPGQALPASAPRNSGRPAPSPAQHGATPQPGPRGTGGAASG